MQTSLEQLDREGRERLHPSVTNPNWLVLRERRKLLQAWLLVLPSGALHVLDVGGRIQPYRPLLAGRFERYVAVDVRPAPLVNVVAHGEHLPFPSDHFDLAICTQVLEYIAQPAQLLSEIRRVLKPGGFLFLSTPAVFPQDSDGDYWRFLSPGVRLLLSSFRDVEIKPEGSSLTGFFRTIAIWLMTFPKPGIIRRLLGLTVIPALNLTAAGLAMIIRTNNDQFAPNFSAFARK